jgi:hypothetical protein
MPVPENSRGWVKGLSMWPNLIPGDILRSEMRRVTELRPGMIAVFPYGDGSTKRVHRVIRVRNYSGFVTVLSAGDRSGTDNIQGSFKAKHSLQVVNGVLRCGRYRKVTRFTIPPVFSPGIFVRLYCGIVRRFQW